MNRTLIKTWLGLTSDDWPPDHYAALGLKAGERNVALIEQRVRERMERMRGYQLSHPEEATEAMNRLAQALVCLTDQAARGMYDMRLAGLSSAPPTSSQAAPVVARVPMACAAATAAPGSAASRAGRTLVDFDTTPMASLASAEPDAPQAGRVALAPGDSGISQAPISVATAPARKASLDPILTSSPADPVFETARSSREATRGLGTRRALYNRLAQTRRLQRAWDRAGDYLSQPRARLAGPAQEATLVRHLTAIREQLEGFPAFLGRPGMPGQHVGCIARQNLIAQTFKMLDVHQRTALAHDWMAGHTLLAQHRQFLRLELQIHRRRTWWGRKVRAVRFALNDHPAYVMLGACCVAGVIALFHWFTAAR